MTNVVNDLPFGTGVDNAYVASISITGDTIDRYELIVEVGGKFVTYNGDVVDTLAEAAAELASEFSVGVDSDGNIVAARVTVSELGALVAAA